LGNRTSRIEINEDGEKKTIYYINDISNPLTQVLQERGENNSVVQSYVYELDLISQINEKNKLDYYLYDGLGSVVGLTSQQGSLIARYSYDEFGVPDPESKFGLGGERSNTYGFTGEDYDQVTGLLYLRARYYMPDVGRFISRDLFEGFEEIPLTLHKYIYCINNPLNYLDSNGSIPEGLARRQAIFDVMASEKTQAILDRWAAELSIDIYAKSITFLILKAVQKNWASAVPYLRFAYYIYRVAGGTRRSVQLWKDYNILRGIYVASYKYWRTYNTAKYLYLCREWGLTPAGPLFIGPRF